ncbi:methyltransferase domain-containing protein [Candidatus Dojkabacteria bacterium]|nr:methyltransferase domain-containing protein [Candidatus Dojkabacteria bacterium]
MDKKVDRAMTCKECPFCTSPGRSLVKEIIAPIDGKKYSLWACSCCDLHFFSPRVFGIEFYETEEWELYRDFHEGRERFPSWSKKILTTIRSIGWSGFGKKVLDIGAGDGLLFMGLKRNYGISYDQYTAIECDEKSVLACMRRGICNIHPIFFNRSTSKPFKNKYDLVVISEVLEHQTDPRELVDAAMSALKKEGLLVITVPNRNTAFYHFREFPGDVPPHHFFRFSKTFFKKWFGNAVVYLQAYPFSGKNLKKTCGVLSEKVLHVSIFWPLFIPVAVMLRIVDFFLGEGIICVVRKI